MTAALDRPPERRAPAAVQGEGCRRDRRHPDGAPYTLSYASARADQVRAVATGFLQIRPALVGAAALVVLAALASAPVPWSQVGALSCGFVVMLSFFAWEAWRGRRRQVGQGELFRSLLLTVAGIGLGCFVTGAIRSPLLPVLLAPVGITFAAFGRSGRSVAACVAGGALVGLLALVPAGFPWPPIPSPQDEVIAAAAFLLTVALLYASVTGLTAAYEEAGRSLDRLRREAVQEARRRTRSLEAMGATVAHEVKNPLSSIKGLTQLMARADGRAPRDARRLEVMAQEVDRMEDILEGYLSFARPLRPLRLEPIDCAALAEGLVELLGPGAAERGVALRAELELTPAVADPGQLRQALLNLALNAIEASSPGQGVTLRVAPADDGGVEVEVRDAGGGMEADALERLGTPFFTTKEGGTGLGVVVAQAVIRQHGGRLRFRSATGEGTSARVHLPPRPDEGG